MSIFDDLTDAQRDALKRIVADWVSEGFTTPPYGDAYYDIFEALDLARAEGGAWQYDTRRPDS